MMCEYLIKKGEKAQRKGAYSCLNPVFSSDIAQVIVALRREQIGNQCLVIQHRRQH